MANAVTLNTAGIVAFISLARAMFWTAYFSNATLAAKASVQRTAIPTTTMEAHPVSTVICSDDCFRVDSSRHSRCCQSVLRSVRHLNYDCILEGTGTRNMGSGAFEEGRIEVGIDMIKETPCDPPIQMTRDACYLNLMHSVDDCDDQSENGKRGGYLKSGCLEYWVNPNPYWWPKCREGECKPVGRRKHECWPTMTVPTA